MGGVEADRVALVAELVVEGFVEDGLVDGVLEYGGGVVAVALVVSVVQGGGCDVGDARCGSLAGACFGERRGKGFEVLFFGFVECVIVGDGGGGEVGEAGGDEDDDDDE